MKNLITMAGIVLSSLLLLTNSGCKKGEDDNLLSLRSRTSRIAGTWNLTAYEIDESSTYNGNTVTINYGYDPDKEVMSYTDLQTIDVEYNYTETIEITKEGTYKQTITKNNKTKTYEGIWYWATKNKELETKNKEVIVMKITKITDDNDVETFDGVGADVAYRLSCLTNKRMIWDIEETITENDDEFVTTGYVIYDKE